MKVIITEQASDSLEVIVDYYLQIAEPSVAFDIHRDILDTIDSLPSFPFKGQLEPSLESTQKGHRRLIYSHYKIVYKIEEGAIFITDIFDTRQDPEKIKP